MTDIDIDRAVRLAMTFDRKALQDDLARLEAFNRVVQPNTDYHDGGWSGISLLGPDGRLDTAASFVPGAKLLSTPALDEAPAMRAVLDAVPGPKLSARLLWLPAGQKVDPHKDPPTNFATGGVRVHVPIVTHPDVEMWIDGQKFFWEEGQLWWGDFSRVHAVKNRSPVDRVHLIVDVEITEALLDLFPPEFVAAQRRSGITLHEPSIQPGPKDLGAFACRFSFPGQILPKNARPGTGEIYVADDGTLRLAAGGATFLLWPLSGNRVRFDGWPIGERFEFEFENRSVRRLRFVRLGLPATTSNEPTAEEVLSRNEIDLPIP